VVKLGNMEQNRNNEHTPQGRLALPLLLRLSAELDGGIRALARHDLQEFEKSVVAQSEICERLLNTDLFTSHGNQQSATPSPGSVSNCAVAEIGKQIEDQKRVYAALIRRSQRFVHTMLALHQSCRGYSAGGSVPLEASTWSGEV